MLKLADSKGGVLWYPCCTDYVILGLFTRYGILLKIPPARSMTAELYIRGVEMRRVARKNLVPAASRQ